MSKGDHDAKTHGSGGSEDASTDAPDENKGGVLTFCRRSSDERYYVLVKSYAFFAICVENFPKYMKDVSLVFKAFDQTCTSAEEFENTHGLCIDFVFYVEEEGSGNFSMYVVSREEDA